MSPSDTKEYRYVGIHPETLANGRPVEPGEFVELTDEDLQDPHNMMLLEDGNLVEAVEPPPEEESPTELKTPKSSKRSGGSNDKEEEN